MELGLQEIWKKQEVSDSWRELVKERIMTAEGVWWSSGVSRNARLEGYVKWKAGLRLEPEEFLSERNVNRRRLWSKLRAGCLELRVETGRWERLTVAGVQKLVPRWARRCTLCYSEVEDAAHVLFRCPAYERLRTAFWLGPGLAANVVRAAQDVQQDQRGQEEVLWKWMMGGAGTRVAMEFLEQVMNERAGRVRQ